MGSSTPIAVVCLGIVSLVFLIVIFAVGIPVENTASFHLIAFEMFLSTALLSMLVPLMDKILDYCITFSENKTKHRHNFEATVLLLVAGKNWERGGGDLLATQLDVMTSMKELLKLQLEKARDVKYIHEKITECNTSSAHSEISPTNEVEEALVAASACFGYCQTWWLRG